MSEHPSRKRAGTNTYAAPVVPARRAKLGSLSHQNFSDSTFPRQDNHFVQPYESQEDHTKGLQNHKFTTVAMLPPNLSSARISKAGVSCPAASRTAQDEYPLLNQQPPTPKNTHLHIIIPHSEPTTEVTNPFSPELHPNSLPDPQPLPTPPRSSPTTSTLFSSSPPSASFDIPPSYPYRCTSRSSSSTTQAPPTPRSSLSSIFSSQTPSTNPSFSSTSTTTTLPSPLSPTIPTSPRTVFDSAATSLKRLLMADDLGMTASEVKDLCDFARSQSRKRSGRVLVKRPVMMRRDSLALCQALGHKQRRTSKEKEVTRIGGRHRRSGSGATRGSVSRYSMEVHSPTQADGQGQAQTWWREVNWSRFSDSSTSTSSSASSFVGLEPLSRDSESVPSRNKQSFDVVVSRDDDRHDEEQSESDGEDYITIDGSPLSTAVTHTAVAMDFGTERRRRDVDLTQSVPDKVGTRAVGGVFVPSVGDIVVEDVEVADGAGDRESY